jgi:hypothetical protein
MDIYDRASQDAETTVHTDTIDARRHILLSQIKRLQVGGNASL